jgi:hypothetical protein
MINHTRYDNQFDIVFYHWFLYKIQSKKLWIDVRFNELRLLLNENGSNLNVDQKQFVCSIRIIHEKFKDCTVLNKISHRLCTILDIHRI